MQNIDISVLHHCCLCGHLLFVVSWRILKRPESATNWAWFINWSWWVNWILSSFSFIRTTFDVFRLVRCREEWSTFLCFVVLSVIKRILFDSCSCTTSSACCYSCNLGCVAIFSFDRFRHWVIQINNKVLVDRVFVWRFWSFIRNVASISSCMSSSMISSYSFRSLEFSWVITMLNCLILNWISTLLIRIDLSSNKFIDNFSALLELFRMNRNSHIEINLSRSLWRSICSISTINSCICFFCLWIFHVCAHSHFLLEIIFCQRITFLSVFYFSVSFVDQMVTGSDVVMTVVFDTFYGILPVKVEFLE